ncbi:hypothetical protein M0Q97_04480 [Candidatus Dojkabacteria bacterium]|jgi:hypothetical protein|nr:hypothetical protein [Candidatus Dojkabacteria bacterium]
MKATEKLNFKFDEPIIINIDELKRGYNFELTKDGFKISGTINGDVYWYENIKGDEHSGEMKGVDEIKINIISFIDNKGEEMTGYDIDDLRDLISNNIEWVK